MSATLCDAHMNNDDLINYMLFESLNFAVIKCQVKTNKIYNMQTMSVLIDKRVKYKTDIACDADDETKNKIKK